MNTHLTQTTRAIKALKAAGFERRHFSVQTPYDETHGGYMDTRIIFYRIPNRDIEAYIPRILATGELNVHKFILNGTRTWFQVSLGTGKLLVTERTVEMK